jgi:hypothetical protein
MSDRKARLFVAAALAVLAPSAAHAQEDFEAIVTIMRACAQIEEISARVTCYDNNIRPRTPGPASPRAERPRAQPPAAAPGGFAADSLRRPSNSAKPEGQAQLRVSRAVEREPGIFLLTLDDGGEWQFVDAAPSSYDVPRSGKIVTIERGALGGFSMLYADQRSIRVRRIR